MRKFYLLFVSLVFTVMVNAQNVNVNPGAGSYPDLGTAFAAINAGTHTGAITVDIVGNTTETAAAVLNASGTGAASYTSVLISPSGGAARTISGAFVGHLIDLNGADNVTIDGLNTGGNSLVISNSATGLSTTIRFIADATNNIVQNCTLQGSTTGAGIVFFSTGVTTGNDGNNINHCNITAAGANLPYNCIYSLGSSAVIDNSGNTISDNNISDFFSATSGTNGLNISTFSSTWTIANNKIFQTATRTYTSGSTHNAISIASGDGYSITGNTIGYASSGATGVYTMAGTTATRFAGILLAVGTTNASSVQGNTVTAINLSTSSNASSANGIICGINIIGGSVNVGNITPNTIGASTGVSALVGNLTTTQGALVGINCSSAGTVVIQNNVIGGMTSSGSTALIAGAVFGINISGAATSLTISGNTIGNATTANMRAGTSGLTTGSSLAAGINITTANNALTISGNTIQNFSSYGTGAAGYVRGIAQGTGGTGATLSGNIIHDLATNNTTNGASSGVITAAGIYIPSGTNTLVNGNTIYNIAGLNTGTSSYMVAGISLATATNTTASNNKIYGMTNAGTGTTANLPPVAAGILVRSGGAVSTPVNIFNNMISLGNGQTSNTVFVGIFANNGSTPDPIDKIYYNTVNIEGTVTSGALSTFCFNRGDFTATTKTAAVDVRNNIFNNTRTGGTGRHFAISNNFGATASATGWGVNASNYNVLNAASGSIGYWTSARTFSGWQTASASDLNSLSALAVPFVNTAAGDLHLNFGVTPTQIESGGTAIAGITTDFDSQTRPGPAGSVNGGGVFPDMGADEVDAVPIDLVAPVITYTPLLNNCSTGGRTLTATITDVSGTPHSGTGLPVAYFNINGGAYIAAAGTWVSGNTYTFSIGTGSVTGDVISYYIVAQDNVSTPDIGSYPSTGAAGFTADPPAVSTPPTAPSTYTILPVLSGTYTVGTGGNFTTLTAAVAAVNNSCLSSAVTLSLTDATYPSETFPITINANTSSGSLTIKPTGTTSITGSSSTALLVINGADSVTIDGSSSSTANTVCPLLAATRDLTFTNTNAVTTAGVVWIATTAGGDPAINCIVQNCIIAGASSTTTLVGLGAGGPTIGSNGTNNDSISFINNDIRSCQFAIYSAGASAVNKNKSLTINQNFINTISPNNVGKAGIYTAYVDNISISGNTIGNIIISSGTQDAIAINVGFLSTGFLSAIATGIADGVSNVSITNNTIGTIIQSATYSAAGIGLGNTISGTSLIANNMIYGVASNGLSNDFASGIVVGGGTAQVNVYHNTVSMQGTITGATAATQASACLSITSSTASPVDIRNNIFSNTQLGNTGATCRFMTIGLTYSSTAGNYTSLLSNYNDLYAAGAGPGTYLIASTGGINSGTARTTLANWQAETGRDAASLNVMPSFTSGTDLHIMKTSCAFDDKGTAVAGIAADYDCNARNASTPDIGADEFTALTSTPAATTGGGQVCYNALVDASGYTYKDPGCNVIARILPSGGSPVTGMINTCVTIDATVQSYNTNAYVQRHFDITPAVNQSTATARITLFVLQGEFDTYNANNGADPKLPNAPGDASGIANLRVMKFSGNGTAPGNYVPGIPTLIDPSDGDIVWDAGNNWWTISFDVTGFSGYYIGGSFGTLPISLLNFSGYKDGTRNQLRWATSSEQNDRGFEVQRSTDGISYTALGFVNTQALGGNSTSQLNYAFTDNDIIGSKQYYRLRQEDFDGKSELSNVVLIKGDKPVTLTIDRLFPNPASTSVNLMIAAPNRDRLTLVISDIAGRKVMEMVVNVEAGNNAIPVNINRLVSGTYMVKLISSSNYEHIVGKFVRQ